MQLTQLQGQNVGQTFTPVGGQINIGSASGNQIQNAGLPSNAAQINITNGVGEIKPMSKDSPVFVNGGQVKSSSPVKFGDTVSVGNAHNVVLGAHGKGESLDAKQIGQHLDSLNFSGEQIAHLTNQIFNFSGNKAIHSKILGLIVILIILLGGIVFGFFKTMELGDTITQEKRALDTKLIEINSKLETAGKILGKSLTEGGGDLNGEYDCDEDLDDCDNSGNNGEGDLVKQSLFSTISDLNSDIKKLKNEQKKAIEEVKKVVENPVETVNNADEKKDKEVAENVEKNTSLINEIIKDFKAIIAKIKLEIKDNSDVKNDFKNEFKDFKKMSSEIFSDKNVLKEANEIRDNKIKESQGGIDDLKKKDDKIDIELKKLKEEINSLEIKIKNLK